MKWQSLETWPWGPAQPQTSRMTLVHSLATLGFNLLIRTKSKLVSSSKFYCRWIFWVWLEHGTGPKWQLSHLRYTLS